jgi:SAM-dependent methyltransferase
METVNQQVKTRRHLRTRGTTRRRSNVLQNVKLNTEAAAAILSPIYASLPNTKAAGQHNLAYGEVEWSTMKLMIESIEKQQWSSLQGQGQGQAPGKFYDLGCGRGRAVLYMALVGPFELSVGVEVLPERIALSQQALTRLKASIPTAGSKVRLYEASFLNPAFKYKDARAIFLSNQSFDPETQTAIFAKLNLEMPKGSLLFCSKLPEAVPGAFETLDQTSSSSEIHILRHL